MCDRWARQTIWVAVVASFGCGGDRRREPDVDAGADGVVDAATDGASVSRPEGWGLHEVCAEILVSEGNADFPDVASPSAAASDGSGVGVAWSQHRQVFGQVSFARLEADEVEPSPEHALTEPRVDPISPSVAWTGTEYGVAWFQSLDWDSGAEDLLRLARVDRTGSMLEEPMQTTTCEPTDPVTIVWTGDEYGVFMRCRGLGDPMNLVRFRAGSQPAVVTVEEPLGDACSFGLPVIEWNGDEYGASWRSQDCRSGSDAVWFARLAADGAVIADAVRVTHPPADPRSGVDLLWADGEYRLAWSDERDGDDQIYVARLDPEGASLEDDMRITVEPANDGSPTLASSGTVHGVAWSRPEGEGGRAIFFAAFDPLDRVVGEPLRVTSPDVLPNLVELLWDGQHFVVLWDSTSPDSERPVHLSRICPSP